MAVADVNVGGETNMPLFLELETWSQPQWAVCTPQDIRSQGLFIEPHPTSQALVMSDLFLTVHLWVSTAKTAKATFFNMSYQLVSRASSCHHSPTCWIGRVG